MTDPELRRTLDDLISTERPHVEHLTIAAAVVSEALRQHGMEATLVGGGALEFYAPSIYSTSDIDLVVEGKTRTELDATLRALGFVRRGRHWVFGDLFVEVPGNWMSDPTETFPVGSLSIRVVRREIVLADRIIGFKHWRATAYGLQAMAMIEAFGEEMDVGLLRKKLREEAAEDAYETIVSLADSRTQVTEAELRRQLNRLHEPKTQREVSADES